ncbi:MAG: hypothetical protein IID46_15750, partial [Planctomycetes bacterium]|nr:hypothetical protein [Planctomycetota bacterium]
MRVKVRDRVYSGEIEPVMVLLSPTDRANIVAMHPDADRYCEYPDEWDREEVREFMNSISNEDDANWNTERLRDGDRMKRSGASILPVDLPPPCEIDEKPDPDYLGRV